MQLDNVGAQQAMAFSAGAATWQGILNAIPVAAYACDADGRIIFFNSLAESVWGRRPRLRDAIERYCGSHQLYLSDGTRISHGQCWTALALLEGKPYHGREIVIERSNGERTLGMAYSHPVRDVQNEVIGAVTLVAELSASDPLQGNAKGGVFTRDSTVAMIEVAASVFASLPWQRSAFH
jgi:PAS domain-containing protein